MPSVALTPNPINPVPILLVALVNIPKSLVVRPAFSPISIISLVVNDPAAPILAN